METNKKTAIVLGATGLVGGFVLNLLLQDDRYKEVIVFSRRDFSSEHPKLKVHVGDLMKIQSFSVHFKADEVYCCIGTTKTKTPDREQYRKIDYGIPVATAKLCRENNIPILIIISAMGANKNSSIFYNKVKGEMEAEVLRQEVSKTHIVQPSLIGGHRYEKRPGELFFKKLMSLLNFLMVGPLKKYRTIQPETIARAMIWLANNGYDETRVTSEELKLLVNDGTS